MHLVNLFFVLSILCASKRRLPAHKFLIRNENDNERNGAANATDETIIDRWIRNYIIKIIRGVLYKYGIGCWADWQTITRSDQCWLLRMIRLFYLFALETAQGDVFMERITVWCTFCFRFGWSGECWSHHHSHSIQSHHSRTHKLSAAQMPKRPTDGRGKTDKQFNSSSSRGFISFISLERYLSRRRTRFFLLSTLFSALSIIH